MPAATRDKEFRRAKASVARVAGDSTRAVNAHHGGALLRCLSLLLLLLACLTLMSGCSVTSAPPASNTTAATSDSNARPGLAERPSEVRANQTPAPTATGAQNPPLAATKGTTAVYGSAETTPAASSEQDGAEASAAYEGFYEVLGARPKGFEQFGNFMIRAPQGGRISGAVVPLEGEIYEFASAALNAGKLTFVTRKVRGVHYSFEGTFLGQPPFASNKKAAVAEGSVRKFRGDQVAAEASMKFYFDEGGEDP
jgi:hypothetical protein